MQSEQSENSKTNRQRKRNGKTNEDRITIDRITNPGRTLASFKMSNLKLRFDEKTKILPNATFNQRFFLRFESRWLGGPLSASSLFLFLSTASTNPGGREKLDPVANCSGHNEVAS
jgi:hypothetical protein